MRHFYNKIHENDIFIPYDNYDIFSERGEEEMMDRRID